jgi:outer membrane protein TolC
MKKIIILMTIGLYFVPSSAQQILSLQQIKDSLLQHYPAFKMLEASAVSLQQAAKGAYSWSAPEVGAGFYMTPYNPEKWKVMNGQPGMGAFMLSAQQMFPNKQKQQTTFAYMDAQATVEEQKKAVVLNDLMFEAGEKYVEWIIAEKKLKVIQENKSLLQWMMQQAETRYTNGVGQINAYYKAKAAFENVENLQLQLHNTIEESRIALNTIMYREVHTPFFIDTTIHWITFNKQMFSATALMQQKSEVKLLNRSIEVNQLQHTAELAQLKPEYGLRFDQMMGWAQQPWLFTAMVTVKLPFAKWSSKMNKAKAESLVWQNEALQQQKQMIVNEASGKANRVWLELQLKKQQMYLYENKIIPALQKNYQTAQIGFAQNTADLFELFDAWQTLYLTQLAYLDEMQTALQKQTELSKIIELQ